ncbi:hypothetical protein [Bacteroides sp.]|uniref:hypothetical protein n=1 Tax=Bacteroides sp. TaxID=29523 RepID=UPI001B748FBF|nr:hypothetical protein [Bacteroides sp.]MBP6065217.1 hypothetical protein [Bacteroides sp.]MBP6067408.1 hypothetical protein [Bacteroides sp.]MBP6936902.1 hypothetical protein [Bacteroides sp.]MBP8622389.1 hypothetical protein [Bacteroides sp.]MBP9506315.1 hypothetical protein [Bacteroides sp.]
MKKVKKSTWVCLALFLYVTATGAYLLPRNTEMGNTEKFVTLGVSYLIVFLLWLVLRKKEEMKRRRREEEHHNQLKK